MRKQNIGLVRILISEYDAPIIVKDIDDNTPMHIAVELKNLAMVKLLFTAACKQPISIVNPVESVNNSKVIQTEE